MSTTFEEVDPEEHGAVEGEVVDDAPEAALVPLVVPIASILDGVDLATALRFVPDVALKQRVETLALALAEVKVAGGGEAALKLADEKIAPVRAAVADIERRFQGSDANPGPTKVIYQLHRRLTGLCADFIKLANATIDAQNKEIAKERKRLLEVAEADRVRRQETANEQVRDNAKAQLEAAEDTGASKQTVAALKKQARSGTAPPVAAVAPPPLAHSTVVEKKRVRFKGTGDHEEPHPKTKEFTKEQAEKARKFFKAVAEGWVPLIAASIEWTELDKLANGQGATFDVPDGMEVFDDSKARSKGR